MRTSLFDMQKARLLFAAVWKKQPPRDEPGPHKNAHPPFLQELPTGASLPHLMTDRWAPHLTLSGELVLPADVWGVPWSEVHDAWWNPELKAGRFEREYLYRYHYLRVTLSVVDGTPGDGILMAVRTGDRAEESAPVGLTHIDVVGEGVARQVRRSTVVNTFFLPGYALTPEDPDPFTTVKARTQVTILGIEPGGAPEVHARVEVIGGFVEGDVPGA